MPDNPFASESLQIIIAQLREENATLREQNIQLNDRLKAQALTFQQTTNVFQSLYNEEQLYKLNLEKQIDAQIKEINLLTTTESFLKIELNKLKERIEANELKMQMRSRVFTSKPAVSAESEHFPPDGIA